MRRAGEFAGSARRAAGSVTGVRERQSWTGDASWLGSSTSTDGIDAFRGVRRPIRLYFPIVRFETEDGRVVETEVMYGTTIASARIGDAVIVLFDPADPTRAQLERTQGRGRLVGIVMVAVGLAACVAGLFTLTVARLVAPLLGG